MGILGALPGCRSFVALQPSGTLLLFRQIVTNGPFLVDQTVLKLPVAPRKVHFVFPQEERISFFIILSAPNSLYAKEIELAITVGIMREIGERTLPPMDISCILWDLRQQQALLVGGVGTATLCIRCSSLTDNSCKDSQLIVDHPIETIISGGERAIVYLVSSQSACTIVSVTAMQVIATAVISPEALVPVTLISPNCTSLHKQCLSANRIYLYHLFSDGCIFECRLTDPLAEDRTTVLPEAIMLGRSVSDIVRAMSCCSVRSIELIPPFMEETMRLLRPSMRKAHLAGTIFSILSAWPQMSAYYAFFVFLWRASHFWEVAVASTEEMGRTLQLLEKADGSNLSFQCDSLPLLTELTIEIVDGMANVFSGDDVIRDRALLVAAIHHRMTSNILLIHAIRQSLFVTVEKYTQKGLPSLLNYFKSYLTRLDSSIALVNLGAISAFLESIKANASESMSVIFKDTASTLNSLRSTTLVTRDRDAVTGRWISPDLQCASCPSCFTPIAPASVFHDEVPSLPFWHAHWQYSCPCGSPL
ncbi:hypothetical protein PSACC_00391 [Paramicrosporidium saccamoebae]|uniref:Uncharacterized protein n=1 Tax=Paramicrosporidium saccamoebae TaxID=1246581 RepID=A0A2H9TPP7_9FUNG|nr:hypothetical protein PSACC_00391 [Paramicrosporidium saccamoebae]